LFFFLVSIFNLKFIFGHVLFNPINIFFLFASFLYNKKGIGKKPIPKLGIACPQLRSKREKVRRKGWIMVSSLF
jgi:hypothetical protein